MIQRSRTILFRVDANSLIGWGHFYRCLALAEMLKDKFNISFAMIAPAAELVEILREKSFELLELPYQEYTTPDERGNKELKFDLTEQLDEVDVVILDGYWFGKDYQKDLRKFPVKVAIIEDAREGSYLADLIINHAPGIQQKGYQTDNKHTKYALGPKYAMLRPSFLEAARGDCKKKVSIEKVLIAFGGSDHYNFTAKTLDWFLRNTSIDLHVIIGAGYEHQHELERITANAPQRVKVDRNLNEQQMLIAMQSADAAVLPASGVLFEAIACRLPVISGTYTQNQKAIFYGFLTEGAIIDGDDFSNLTKAWSALINTDLSNLRKKQASLVDGYSDERLRVSLTMLSSEDNIRIRPAELKDVKLYFYWANDNAVRANAFNQERIEWGNHKSWYENKLIGKYSKLMVLECSGISLGQIRFDKNDEGYWEIDYSIDYKYRGIGLGSIIVRKGIEQLNEEERGVKIKAMVKPGNHASLRIFREISFTEFSEENCITFCSKTFV